MFKIITEIWSARGDDDVLFASNCVQGATVIPSAKDSVLLRTASKGGPDASILTITSVQTLASYDGFRAYIWNPSLLENDEATRALRKELHALDWDFVLPEPPLPPLADADDFDDD